jgi:transcriptional regulator of arginine metabolism
MLMSELKDRRQRAIADLIRSSALSSQDDLAARLAQLGHVVTQATISRDLEQLGAVKVRRSGQLSYALPDQVVSASTEPRLAAVLRDWVRSIDVAGNLVIIKSPPGSAHLIGVALDQSDLPAIAGTVCGDDTIFVACRSVSDAADAAKDFKRAVSGEPE